MTRRRRLVGTQRAFVANLMVAVKALTPEDLNAGRAWYPAQSRRLAAIAAEYGVTFEQAAYAAAALSPGLSWDATIETLLLLLDARQAGDADFPRGRGHLTFGYRDRAKAWAILSSAAHNMSELCRGPKVEAIAAALLGDLNAVPVDRHIVRAATASEVRQVSPATTGKIAASVSILALARGLRPAELQAALWTAGHR